MVAYGGFFPTLIVSPTDMERLTTYLTAYGGFFPTLIVSPTDMERLTTYGGVWWVVIFRPSNNMLICRHDIVCP